MTSVLQENLTGIRVVRAFANQDYEIKRFSGKNEVYRDKVYHLIWLLACYWSSSDAGPVPDRPHLGMRCLLHRPG